MCPLHKTMLRIGLLGLIFSATIAQAADFRPYDEATYGQGKLQYIAGLPVLVVRGTPEQIGRQKAALTAQVVKNIADYPKRLLKMIDKEDAWPKFVEKGRVLMSRLPADYKNEIRVFAEEAGIDQETGIVSNTMIDTYRGGFGCSSLIVDAKRSATGGPLLGRNLDFYTLGLIDGYSLVTVHRPKGKHAFAAVGYPGMFGCISGINDAGLALAVHEVFFSRDGAPIFDPKGLPYAFCFRRMLEECATVEEAEALLRNTKRTTILSLSVCDRHGGAVFEMTPKTVAVRRGEDGICACTNHFRTDELGMLRWCGRYSKLIKARADDLLQLSEVADKLHEVNQGRLTVQTMIFEPAPLRLHLAIGSSPSSALPLARLDLAELFGLEPPAAKSPVSKSPASKSPVSKSPVSGPVEPIGRQ